MIQEFEKFKQTMVGKNPKEMVMELLNSGKMTQEQFEEYKKQADVLSKYLR